MKTNTAKLTVNCEGDSFQETESGEKGVQMFTAFASDLRLPVGSMPDGIFVSLPVQGEKPRKVYATFSEWDRYEGEIVGAIYAVKTAEMFWEETWPPMYVPAVKILIFND